MSQSIEERRQTARELQQRIKEGFPAPEALSDEATRLWAEVVPMRARSPEKLAAIEVALRCFDRLREIQAELKPSDFLQTTERTGAQHVNPLLREEREVRKQFMRLWSGLHLDWRGEWDALSMSEIENPETITGGMSYSH